MQIRITLHPINSVSFFFYPITNITVIYINFRWLVFGFWDRIFDKLFFIRITKIRVLYLCLWWYFSRCEGISFRQRTKSEFTTRIRFLLSCSLMTKKLFFFFISSLSNQTLIKKKHDRIYSDKRINQSTHLVSSIIRFCAFFKQIVFSHNCRTERGVVRSN